MESAAVLRSIQYSIGNLSSRRRLSIERLSAPSVPGSIIIGKIVSSPIKQRVNLVSCSKTSEIAATTKADLSSTGNPQSVVEKIPLRSATFPNGFEALVLDVCDETEVAELKLKVGDFEMHLKRNVGATKAPMPVMTPPIPSETITQSTPAAPPSPPSKPSPEKSSPFINLSLKKSSKLEALEASGSTGYVLVVSPRVGSIRRGRTVKGKRQPPICKEGDVIKEGQTIGYLDQFGTELPVKSDKAGEVLKLLFDDGEAVGYGDPLIALV